MTVMSSVEFTIDMVFHYHSLHPYILNDPYLIQPIYFIKSLGVVGRNRWLSTDEFQIGILRPYMANCDTSVVHFPLFWNHRELLKMPFRLRLGRSHSSRRQGPFFYLRHSVGYVLNR